MFRKPERNILKGSNRNNKTDDVLCPRFVSFRFASVTFGSLQRSLASRNVLPHSLQTFQLTDVTVSTLLLTCWYWVIWSYSSVKYASHTGKPCRDLALQTLTFLSSSSSLNTISVFGVGPSDVKCEYCVYDRALNIPYLLA